MIPLFPSGTQVMYRGAEPKTYTGKALVLHTRLARAWRYIRLWFMEWAKLTLKPIVNYNLIFQFLTVPLTLFLFLLLAGSDEMQIEVLVKWAAL